MVAMKVEGEVRKVSFDKDCFAQSRHSIRTSSLWIRGLEECIQFEIVTLNKWILTGQEGLPKQRF